jgi:hypothetical protein
MMHDAAFPILNLVILVPFMIFCVREIHKSQQAAHQPVRFEDESRSRR